MHVILFSPVSILHHAETFRLRDQHSSTLPYISRNVMVGMYWIDMAQDSHRCASGNESSGSIKYRKILAYLRSC
jgi:hypothetical protein